MMSKQINQHRSSRKTLKERKEQEKQMAGEEYSPKNVDMKLMNIKIIFSHDF